jgi:hypothetical protein
MIPPALHDLSRAELVPVALDVMLSGMIVTRGLLPQVALESGDMDLMNQIAIDEWMGASPIYTGRMRRLMGIEGDNVQAIMKALQLDVGFVHQYMDVHYELIDDRHAEFWLAHCGALIDAEPHGEERVFGMCHTIEDPTFDATALATNPRARIRPIHRPPRRPADQEPHCRWTITIDPENDPVGSVPLTEVVAALPLASVPNAMPDDREPGGRRDYRGDFEPSFGLSDLSWGALVAATREFEMQSHLLMAASDLALREHFDADTTHTMMLNAWESAGWIASERLTRLLPPGDVTDTLARVLALTPMLAPGFERQVQVDRHWVTLDLRATHPGLLDAGHAGWNGLLAAGERRGVEGIARGVDRRAHVEDLTVDHDRVHVGISIDPEAEPAQESDAVALARIGMVSGWTFDTTDRVADPVVVEVTRRR